MAVYTFADGKKRPFCGAKAENLFAMKKAGFNVPDFFVTDVSSSEEETALAVKNLGGELFSVRSSADCEDGGEKSFAGQFKTFLFVPAVEVYAKVKECLEYVRAQDYEKAAGIRSCGKICCIVQKMISPRLSGVIFTANPNGRLNETVICLGEGVGENVVSGRCPVTHYYINRSDNSRWYETQDGSPLGDNDLIDGLYDISERISKFFGFHCDIEFAVTDGDIFILQARKITTLGGGETIILDSSNICESYPGVSLPLTQDFVSKVYYGVFRSVCLRLTKSPKTVKKLDPVLKKMTDCADGRIYYRISGWYDVIKILPFSDKIIPVWQEMLGVEDKTVTSDFKASAAVKLTAAVQFFNLLFTNNRRMRELDRFFKGKIAMYRREISRTEGTENLLKLYRSIRNEICAVWDITLVNDMYTFIYTGLLKAALKRRIPESCAQALNTAVYGGGDLDSMKPVKALAKLRGLAEEYGLVNRLEEISGKEDWLTFCADCEKSRPDYMRLVNKYISLYGDRAPFELKLEAKTPRTNPQMLAGMICSASPALRQNRSADGEIRLNAAERFLAKRARTGVKQREKSRLDRSRLYGIMREIILKAAEGLCVDGRLNSPDDIFFLSCKEIQRLDKGGNYFSEILRRKRLYKLYALMPSPKRIVFSGKVASCDPANVNSTVTDISDGIFRGAACSAGIVTGEVVKVTSPDEISPAETRGKIIAAKMTDPGWVTLIAESAGLICERGSLLSHTAIISRELKKPAVAGVGGIFDVLKNGDKVTLNGGEGTVIVHERTERKYEMHT